eukprot:12970419-Ditylum_brightwellii.AAC.1
MNTPVPTGVALAYHYQTQANLTGLATENAGGMVAAVAHLPLCMLLSTAWVPYFLAPTPDSPAIVAAQLEKLAIFLWIEGGRAHSSVG